MNDFDPEEKAALLAAVEQAVRALEPWEKRMQLGWPWLCLNRAVTHLRLLAGIILRKPGTI